MGFFIERARPGRSTFRRYSRPKMQSCIFIELKYLFRREFSSTLKPKIKNPLCGFIYFSRPERFELPTPWFEARYSIQLSYGRRWARIMKREVQIYKRKMLLVIKQYSFHCNILNRRYGWKIQVFLIHFFLGFDCWGNLYCWSRAEINDISDVL